MYVVAFGVAMPVWMYLQQVFFPLLAMSSLPILLLAVFVQIVVLAKSGAFGDGRRIWIAPSVILTVLCAMSLRMVMSIFLPDASILPPHHNYARYVSLHVLLSNAVPAILFTLLVLKRERAEYLPKPADHYLRWVMPTCGLMLLPGIITVGGMVISSLAMPGMVIAYSEITKKIHTPLLFIALPAFVYHLSMIGNLARIGKRSEFFWVGNSLVLFVIPVFYYCLQMYLISIGRYQLRREFSTVLAVALMLMVSNVTSALKIRKLASHQIDLENHMRSVENT